MKVYDELLLKRIAAVGWQIHMVLPAAWQLPRLNDTSSSATSPQSQKLLHQLTKTTWNTGKKLQVQNLVRLRVWNFGVFSKCTNNFELYRTGIMNPLHYKTLSWHILLMSIPVGTKCMFSINRKYFITFTGKLHMSVCNSHFTRVFFCLRKHDLLRLLWFFLAQHPKWTAQISSAILSWKPGGFIHGKINLKE